MKKFLKHNILLYFIIIVAFLYRIRGLFNPLTDYHSWRQTDTASVAYNFYVGGMNILKPQLNVYPQIRELEFHIYPYIVALLYKIFGFHEYLGRIVSIFFGLGTIIFIYLIAKLFFDEKVALWSSAFFAVSPMSVYYNRTFMPESCMLFFITSGMYYFLRWVKESKSYQFILSLVLLSFAFLTKITSVHILLTVVYLLYLHRRKNFVSWMFIPLVLVLPFLWYYYWHQVCVLSGGGCSFWEVGKDKWFNIPILTNLDFYRRIWLQYLGELHFAYSGYLFFIIGFFTKLQKEQKFLRVWVLSVFVYFIVVAVGNYVHEYYQLPMLIPGSILVGVGIQKLYSKYGMKLWLLILLLWLPIYGFTKSRDRMKFDFNYKIAGEYLNKISHEEDKIVVISDGEPEVLYYAKRKGWHVDLKQIYNIEIEKFVQQGAKYLVILPKEKKVNLNLKNPVVGEFSSEELDKINKVFHGFEIVYLSKNFVVIHLGKERN